MRSDSKKVCEIRLTESGHSKVEHTGFLLLCIVRREGCTVCLENRDSRGGRGHGSEEVADALTVKRDKAVKALDAVNLLPITTYAVNVSTETITGTAFSTKA